MYFPDGFMVTPKAIKEFCQKQPFEVMRRNKKKASSESKSGPPLKKAKQSDEKDDASES